MTAETGEGSAAVPVPGGKESRPEPVLMAAVAPIVTAVLGLLVAFGVDLTDDQRNAVLGVVAALVPVAALIANWVARNKVTPLASPHDAQNRRLVTARPGLPPAAGMR